MKRPQKKAQKRKPLGGPYLAAAVFCDNILQGEDKAMSAIRIVDHVTVIVPASAPADVPSESKHVPVYVWTLIMFKTAGAKGKHLVSIEIESPSGKRIDGPKHEINLGPEPQGGANLKIHMGLGIKEGGLFLIDVSLDGNLMTRMPLLISVSREEAKSEEPATEKLKRKRG